LKLPEASSAQPPAETNFRQEAELAARTEDIQELPGRLGPRAIAAVAPFTAALLLSALLLFVVEPMFAKMVLPLLGGSPAVWTTCLMFFQAVLLGGYAYAHFTLKRLGVRRQAILHLGLLLLALLLLPVRLPPGWVPPVDRNPSPWLLLVALVVVGLPFFLLSATSPVLQAWFARSAHPASKDPYFLFAASNLGSIVGLLSYPAILEPTLRLGEQSRLWTWSYALLVILVASCAGMTWKSLPSEPEDPRLPAVAARTDPAGVPSGAQKLRWLVLAFVPSSLMLGVTSYLSMDVPSIPLLWVVPLAIYLATFVLVFARKPPVPHDLIVERMPFLVVASAIIIFCQTTEPFWLLAALNLLTFFVVAMMCHGELVRCRPSASHLTSFYLWLSLGGVLGGVFNALVAPLVFRSTLEYPLVLILAVFLRPPTDREIGQPHFLRWDFLLPLAVAGGEAALVWGLQAMRMKPGELMQAILFVPAGLLCLSFARRRVRFALGLLALLVGTLVYTGPYGRLLARDRSFFGTYRIFNVEGRYRTFVHGTTIHGVQALEPARRRDPLAYYAASGPAGEVFAGFSRAFPAGRVALVGLGVGSLACYRNASQKFTFYEIDPRVKRFARDPRYFTFLRDCAPQAGIVLGDARLSLAKEAERKFDLIVLDAFSSDAIPMHLLTREAMQLYLARLAPSGVLVFNISNRHLNLRPVLSNLATNLGLACLARDDLLLSQQEVDSGKFASRWMVLARSPDDFRRLGLDDRWQPSPGRTVAKVWSDDFSNILGSIAWQ